MIKYSVHNAHFPTIQRDLVCLRFHELMPDEEFAIVAFKSIERPDVPPVKGCVRAIIGKIDDGMRISLDQKSDGSLDRFREKPIGAD